MHTPRTATLTLLVALLSATVARAETKDLKYTSTPILTTGDLSQFPSDSKLFVLSGQASDNTATFYGLWDQQALYFGVDVQDTSLYCNSLGADSQIAWSNDGIELNFDLLNKKTLSPGDQDFRQWIFPVNFNNNAYDAYGTGDTGDTSFTGTATVVFQLNGTLNDSTADTGYTAIISIPWSDLGLTPANALTFGFDGAVNDRDDLTSSTTWADWANLQVFAQPDKWNALRLMGGPSTPAADGSVAPVDGYVAPSDLFPPTSDGGTTTKPRPADDLSCDCNIGRSPTRSRWQLVLGLLVLGWCLRRHRR